MTQPKKRVYELARELNLTNKVLLEKIGLLELGINSHMSTLDDDAETTIRNFLQGKGKPELEEKRIKPTVIRRRRKTASEQIEESVEAEAAVEAQLQEPQAAEVENTVTETVKVEKAEPSKVKKDKPVQKPSKPKRPAKKTFEKAKVVKQASQPEKTIEETPEPVEAVSKVEEQLEAAEAQPETFEEQPETSEAQPETTEEQPETLQEETVAQQAEPVPPIDPQALKDKEKPATSKAPSTKKALIPNKVKEKPLKAKEKPSKAKEKPSKAKEKPSKVLSSKAKPAAKPKKKKREIAAKIIKLPERPSIKKPEPAPAPKPRPVKPVRPVEAPALKEERPKKKGKKKALVNNDVIDKPIPKKRSSFRKKEVIEGADLYSGRQRSRKSRKGAKAKEAAAQKTQITTAKAIKRRIKIDETIILSELAKRMGIKASEMIAKLFNMGVMATVNQTIDYDTASLVAAEFNYEIENATFEEEAILKTTSQDDPGALSPRPPVVTIMGHVDHGKTSLLDVIRKSRVTAGEAGGITQHIGAYLVSTGKGDVAFLDTPGHEAFSAMRSRGAHITDIVILVVAADDGVMPQTVEAINHSKAAKVPIIVAVNKIDKPDAEPDRVKRQLAELDIVPEDWGGEHIFVNVSAKQKTGIDDLLEMILLQSEMLELKANPNKLAIGHVVEAKLDAGRGPVATVLVKEGTLRAGDAVVCGVHYGKVRALLDDYANKMESAGPSNPAEIIGLSGVPMAGDEMVALKDEKDAKQVSQHRAQKHRAKELAKTSRLSLDKLYERMQEGEIKDLNIIVKADVDGSMEAIRDSLNKLSNPEVNINIIHSATGTITESDISLAAVSEAIIIGFNVRPNPKVQEMANEERVDIRYHNIIYNVIKEIKDAIVGMMESTFEERILGQAEVRQIFHVPKIGTIAGCYVTNGKIERGQKTRLLRDGIVVYDGKNSSLRRFKDDVKEVQSGYECGIGLENYNDIKIGDIIDCYYLEEIKPEVD
ncbi:MAG: translation initiation factor IF-2 [Desulfobacteraceae bacterium]|nr:translation initiation factor IF-2 [Desulfobacteraceae bacterium]